MFGLLLSGSMGCVGDEQPPEAPGTESPSDFPEAVVISDDPDEVPTWEFGSPVFTVGAGIEAGPEDADPTLEWVRDGVFLSDGSILVVDGMNRLQHYDSLGQHITTFGGPGEGPSEFGSIGTLSVTDHDTVFVYDIRQRAVKVYHPAGGFQRAESLPHPPETGGGASAWRHGDGYLHLATDWSNFDREGIVADLGPDELRSVRHTAIVQRLVNGEPTGNPLRFRGDRDAYRQDLITWQPFAPEPSVATNGRTILYSEGDEFVIVDVSGDLESRRTLTWPAFGEPVDREELRSVRERIRSTGVGTEEMFDVWFSDELVPEQRPVVGDLILDSRCRIWVARFEVRDPWSRIFYQRRWFILSWAGEPLGRLDLPPEHRMTLLDVADDRVLVVRLGGLDEPYVEVRPIDMDGSVNADC